MERVPEPELMDDPAQAQAYAKADFSEPHGAFIEHFRNLFPGRVPHRVLDLGCGAADISVRFARAWPEASLTALDGAVAMLSCARACVQAAGLEARITLCQRRLPDLDGIPRAFDAVISNSLLHHLHRPEVMWRAIKSIALPGASVLVMDLSRPPSREAAEALVAAYAANEPPVLQRDFLNSLCAAFRPEEVRRQLEAAGLAFSVEAVSDRHLLVHGSMPGA